MNILRKFQSFECITTLLVALIISQDADKTVDPDVTPYSQSSQEEKPSEAVYYQLTPELKRCADLSKERVPPCGCLF